MTNGGVVVYHDVQQGVPLYESLLVDQPARELESRSPSVRLCL